MANMENCNYCDKVAVANYQKVWVKWAITPQGDYAKEPDYDGARELNDREEPTGEDNIHVCEEHEQRLLDAELDY